MDIEGEAASLVDARAAARFLGVSQRAVRNLVANGRLKAERQGEGSAARVLVSVASVERLRSERQEAGKQPNG